MTILSVILMGGTLLFVDEKIHQILGIAMFVLWTLHAVLNRRWFSAVLRAKYPPYRIMQFFVNIGISISAIFVMASGILMAWFVKIDFGLAFARTFHLIFSHWYYFFMCLHLGLHVQMIFKKIKTVCAKNNTEQKNCIARKILKIFSHTVQSVVCLYGAYAFFNLGIAKYMFFLQKFFFLDVERGYFLFAVDYISVLVLIATVSHFLGKLLTRFKK